MPKKKSLFFPQNLQIFKLCAAATNHAYLSPPQMLFNVNTIGSCFFTDKFYIETNGQFAGACILALVLVVALEALRRATREFDRFIKSQHVAQHRASSSGAAARKDSSEGVVSCVPIPPFRPSLLQQAVRASLHMLQFGTAYIVML